MQKVITVYTYQGFGLNGSVSHAAKEYPEVEAYLNQGYKVSQIVPITPKGDSSLFALTFVLEK